MVDNNINSTMEMNNGQESYLFLKSLSDEFKEQLNMVIMNENQVSCTLREKEQELSEKEQSKVQNLDLFSPIYNKSHDTTELINEIEDLKHQMDIHTTSKLKLIHKIDLLNNATKCMNNLLEEQAKKTKYFDHNIVKKIGDTGLSILEAQEIERQRIARDLHDTTVQNLTSLVHKSELCIKLIDMDVIRAKLELTNLTNNIKTTINDMRGIIYDLKPMSLDDLGLSATVERYAKQLMMLNDLKILVHSNEEQKDILPVIKVTLFRIIQEACCNILKHAHASAIEINIFYNHLYVTVTIIDNGIGFDSQKQMKDTSNKSSSFGLSIMKERISLLSGTMEIQSEKGKGTIINVSVPLTLCEGDKNEQAN